MRRIALLGSIWGWSFLLIKVAVEGLTPTTVAATRITLGALTLLVVLRSRSLRIPRTPELWGRFAVAALLNSALPFSLLAWGEERITSALTSVLNAATPLFAALCMAVALGERLRRGQLAGLGLGFVGVGVAAGLGAGDLTGSSLPGAAAAIGAAACYGGGIVYVQRHMLGLDPIVAAAGQLLAGSVILAPFAIATSVSSGIDLTSHRIVAVVLLGVVGTGLAYILHFRNIGDLGSTKASTVTYVVPVVAVTVGVVFLDEPFHLRLLAGAALTLVGITLLRGGRLLRRRAASAAAPTAGRAGAPGRASGVPVPEAWGIASGYRAANGEWTPTSPETTRRLLEAMGADAPRPPATAPVLVVRAGEQHRFDGRAEIVLEDGTKVNAEERLPSDLPLGYHRLCTDAGEQRLVVSPGRCHLPQGLRTWGWSAQLYAMRSRTSWGIGDLGDLRELTRWSRGQGAGMVLLNPLHAASPVTPQQPSPYSPNSRVFRNPLYLRVEDVPGATAIAEDLAPLAAAGRALNEDRHIDRDAVLRHKLPALELLWARFGGDPAFDAWRIDQGELLEGFATYCVLAEEHGGSWLEWPAELRRPGSAAVREVARASYGRLRFHQWLQWLLDTQLEDATRGIDAMQDLAIGVDRGGADSWLWQDVLASGVTVGAPPDEFNTKGQDWGLPPFDPWKLRAAAFEPFVRTIRAGFRHAGGLRVDHVMGLYRLYWVPDEAGPTQGSYVAYPDRELLDIVALESHRAKAYVVGEDLGTVEEHVRGDLRDRGVLSYRLWQFEESPPGAWPEQALAAVTTHDLPTVAGLWSGADLEAQKRVDLDPNLEATAAVQARLPGGTTASDVVLATYEQLAAAPCMILSATLDDALAVEERPNMPGTMDEWPNWSIALPVPFEELARDPRAAAIAVALGRARQDQGRQEEE